MECAKIKELLSEYIDNVLDAKAKAAVEEHLKSCSDCSKELASLKAYISDMGILKDAKAPDGFLKSVHERIDRRFEFEKIMRKIFVPIHIKVPIEALAVAASVMLILIVYRSGGSPLSRVLQTPLSGKMRVLKVQQAKKPAVPATEDKMYNLAELQAVDEVSTGAIVRQRTTAARKQETVLTDSLDGGYTKKQAIQEPQSIEIALAISLEPVTTSESLGGYEHREELMRSLYDKSDIDTVGKEEISTKAPTIISSIAFIADSLEGTVENIEYNKETSILEYITLKIPANNYKQLTEKLAGLGHIQGGLKDEPIEDVPQLVVRIKVTTSN